MMPMLHPEDEPIPEDMPNLKALDAELEARIRRLVHAELKPLIEEEVTRQLAEKEKIDGLFLIGSTDECYTPEGTLQTLPAWAREDGV